MITGILSNSNGIYLVRNKTTYCNTVTSHRAFTDKSGII